MKPEPSSNSIVVFDRAHIRRARQRCAKTFDDHSFLYDWVMSDLTKRLELVMRDFPVTCITGARKYDQDLNNLQQAAGVETPLYMDDTDAFASASSFVQADEDLFPFRPQSLDACINIMNLHNVNDLPGALIQMRQSLKPDGLFIGAMLGGETLFELRSSLMHAEQVTKGGISPRIAPFTDKKQMGALMQRAGFALPVVDLEIITVSYKDMFKLMHDLRYMGESNSVHARLKNFTPKSLMMKAAEYYHQHFTEQEDHQDTNPNATPDTGKPRLFATFEIIFMIGWAPHASQQQPLKPGSATIKLADILDTQEVGTNVKTTD